MTHAEFDTLADLDARIVGRTRSLFADDLAAADQALSDTVRGARILVIGGAGTIGSSTLRTVLRYRPALVHVIDHNENGLAELVRGLRSSVGATSLPDMMLLPFDVGGDPFRLWLAHNDADYDVVLNFAALKHVRTEKDPYSVLAMLEANVLHLDQLSTLLARQPTLRRVFSVSTDKAANPSSMMGATKRLMEHALFHPQQQWPSSTVVTSARFANVAFSNGSLLQAWQHRLRARQPLACPIDTRRYFVSIAESGHLCTLAGLAGADRRISVPSLDPEEHLVLLSDIVERFLEHEGFEPTYVDDENEARAKVAESTASGRWPVLLTPLDTGGEKPYEEFIAEGEKVHESHFESLREVEYLHPEQPDDFPNAVAELRKILASDPPMRLSDDSIKDLIASVEPAFRSTHRSSSKSLDQRM